MSSSKKEILTKISDIDKKINKIFTDDALKIYAKTQELNLFIDGMVRENYALLTKMKKSHFTRNYPLQNSKIIASHVIKNPLLMQDEKYVEFVEELYETQFENYFNIESLKYNKIDVEVYDKKWKSINKDIAKMTVFVEDYANEKLQLLRKLT